MSFSTIPYLTKPKPGVRLNPLHPLSRGLVGYWLFNEGTGSRANDISGRGNHGTLNNMSPNAQDSGWGGSKFGGGLQFDGVNDFVDCGSDESLDLVGNDFAVEAWVYPTTVTRVYIRKGTWSSGGWYLWVRTNGQIAITVNDATSGELLYSDNNAYSLNQWNHIIVVWNHSLKTAYFYVNGESKGSGTTTKTMTEDASNFIIGRYDSLYALNGSIDSVRIYNRALSAAEVKTLYHDPFCNLLRVPVRYVPAAPPIGAIMNQFQNFNIGADLYNGAIIA